MRVLLIVLMVLAALVVLLCVTRVGALAVLGPEGLALDVKIGVFRLHILPKKEEKPGKPKKEKKKKKKKEKEPAEGKGEGKPKKKGLKFTAEDILDAVKTLWPPLKRALGRTRRGIRVDPMALAVTLGGATDPAAAAQTYGEASAAVWTAMPVLERLLDIPDPNLHLDVDFGSEAVRIEGRVGVTIRIGTILAVGLGIGFPVLRWFLRFRKKQKKLQKQQKAARRQNTSETVKNEAA